jgi:hypothetical protein
VTVGRLFHIEKNCANLVGNADTHILTWPVKALLLQGRLMFGVTGSMGTMPLCKLRRLYLSNKYPLRRKYRGFECLAR